MKHAYDILAIHVILLFSISASANGWNFPSNNWFLGSQGSVTGPKNYHMVYANIEDTIVTLQNFRLRSEDGQVVSIKTAPIEVDLQELQAVGDGLPLNLTGVTLPDNAPTMPVAEVEMDIVGKDARIVSKDNSACELATPKKLNLYTQAPITVIAGEQYLVKVVFTPLNAIQLDMIKKKHHGRDCDRRDHKHYGRHDRHDSDNDESELRCELTNRRHLVNDIIRPIDEG